MTRAPSNLLAVRGLLLDHLGPHGLTSAEVGIVGDAAHRGGYHCGSDRVDADDYSVDESPRDAAGLTLDASALDVGQFSLRVGGKSHSLASFSVWLVAQCKAGAADTRDIREVIYSPDGTTVKRWDRLGKRTGGDGSHRWHTHISFFRDSTKAGRDQTPLFRRYLTTIGILENDMPLTADEIERIATAAAAKVWDTPWKGVDRDYPASSWLRMANTYAARAMAAAEQAGPTLAALRKDVADIGGRDLVDEQQVAVELAPLLLTALTPEAIAAAIPDALARQVADELAARLAD